MSSGINRDEWLKALEEVGYSDRADPGAVTAQEFADMFQIDIRRAGERLHALVRANKATRTTKLGRTISGQARRFVAYRLTP